VRPPASIRLASDVFAGAVRKGVQLHGSFGFTWDCDVHFYFKRALVSRAMLGDAAHHRRVLARELLG
jgi:alkylation response protein AidB-like acyl-CoA dehydrogenase